MNEIFYAIFGKRTKKYFMGRLKYYTSGRPSYVNFDYDKVIKEHDRTGRLIGFYHTHPNWTNQYSIVDERTMESLVDALGTRLLCIIRGTNGTKPWDCYNIYGSGGPHFIMNDPQSYYVIKIGNFIFGRIN